MKIGLKSTNPVGFRLSLIDIAMLLIAGLATYFYPPDFLSPAWLNNLMHWSIPFVVGNFFLFCNVFRVRTKYELWWTVVALVNLYSCLSIYNNALMFFATQSVMTVIVITFEIFSKSYHGLFAKKSS